MHANRSRLRLAAAGAALLLAAAQPAAAQVDTTAVPSPPTAELEALEPFFGSYEHSGCYWMGAGPFAGTFEVRPAIKGWYVEWVVDTRFGPIDRELRLLTTWDADLGRYRVWGFDTNPQSPPGTVEGEARFDGDEFVMEWKESRGPSGERGTFRNRMRMESPGVLVTHSEAEPEGGDLVVLGVWRHRRVGTAAEAAVGVASGRGGCE